MNRMINSSSKEIFEKYTKEVLKYSEGKPSLIQLVNERIKTKDTYVAYVINHTPLSCCQRGSTRLKQNHSIVSSHLGNFLLVNLKKC